MLTEPNIVRELIMNRKIVDYITVTGELLPPTNQSTASLSSIVRRMMERGYQPFGSPFPFGREEACQAMVKYEDEKSG